jgi:cyclophilin family peptidyl-prolyl cis-trans isomerase
MKHLIMLYLCFGLSTVLFAQKDDKKKESDKDYVITMHTPYGDMVILLYDQTPLHKANFIKLVQEKFYDSTTFHRIIQGFMIQGGDAYSKDDNPGNDGMGGTGYTIPAEMVAELKHKKGALAAARTGDQVNPQRESNGSQFYIVSEDNGANHLDGLYTIYGQVVDGLEVIGAIEQQLTDTRNRPLENIYMTVTMEEMKKEKIIKKYNAKSFYKTK